MNYIVFYKKNHSDIETSCFYTISLQQVLNFYINFAKDLKFLYVTLFNYYQDKQITLIECNKSFVDSNISVDDLRDLLRKQYNLDSIYFLP